MKKAWAIIEALFCLTALIIVALFIDYAMPHPVGKPDKDAWDILTACGTVSATAAAVWLGLRQELASAKAAKVRAHIIAARITPQLNIAVGESSALMTLLDWYNDLGKHDRNYLERLEKIAGVAAPRLTTDELTDLIPLPDQCAHLLARASGQADVLQSAITYRLNSDLLLARNEEQEIAYWFSLSKEIAQSLETALSICSQYTWSLIPIDQHGYSPVSEDFPPF